MSEPVARQRPTVDLDDFERRLRKAQTQPNQPHAFHDESVGHDDDPLTELARLVGDQPDPYGDVFAREAVARPLVQPDAGRREPTSALQTSPRIMGNFAAIEAGLRGTFPGHADMHAPAEPQLYADHDAGYHDAASAEPEWRDAPSAQQTRRTGRPVYAMVAAIAIGVIGIGVAFAYKGTGSSPREIKTIMAATGPTKIQPPVDIAATANQDGPDAGSLAKGQDTPTKLVSREEQPVDLSQALEENARNAAAQGRGAGASSVDVPLPPGQVQSRSAGPTASPDYSTLSSGGNIGGVAPDAAASPVNDQAFGAGMPAPKKVKVVSVRPDGTILPNGTDTPDTAPASEAPVAAPTPMAHPPKATKTAKSTSRVTSKPLDLAAAATDGNDASNTTTPKSSTPKAAKVKKPKPQHVASVETGAQDATDATAPTASDTVTSGGFAVQLAAPGSEAEAKSVSSKLGAKFADALSGHHLGYRRVESNGKSVYRVRVGGLSKGDAASLCAKLKADGGACFIAKN